MKSLRKFEDYTYEEKVTFQDVFPGKKDVWVELSTEERSKLKHEVFEKVDFYVNSGDEYIGEFGTVRIELNEEQADFEYTKSTTSEHSERLTESFIYQFTDEEFNIFRDKIEDINGEGRSVNFNYKSDCIISDDEISILEKFEGKIIHFINNAIIENEHGDPEEESENFECDVEDTLNTAEKTIEILVSRSFYYTVSE